MEFKKESQQQAKSFSEALAALVGAQASNQALEKAVSRETLSSFVKEFGKGSEFWRKA